MTLIRSTAPIPLILHTPQSPDGRKKLARRVSNVHAAAVIGQLQALSCPASRKKSLLAAVLERAADQNRQRP